MAWIESHQELRQHPKLKRLCRSLKCSPQMAVGLLHFLWWWAVDFAPDGSLHGYNAQDIADAIDWTEDADALLKALTSAGFLDETPEAVVIHDWPDHGAKTVNRQSAARERQRRWRAKQDAEAQSEAVLSTSNAHVTRDNGVSNAHVTRPHDMTGHDMTNVHVPCTSSEQDESDPFDSDTPPDTSPVQAIFGHYKERIQPQAKLCPTDKIKARLKRFSEDELRTAIDHFAADAWWMEHNGTRGGGWFFHSDQRIEQFLLMTPRKEARRNGSHSDYGPGAPISDELRDYIRANIDT